MTDTANNDAGNQPSQDDLEWDQALTDFSESKGIETSNDNKGGENAGKTDDAGKGADSGDNAAAGTGTDGDQGKAAEDAKKDDGQSAEGDKSGAEKSGEEKSGEESGADDESNEQDQTSEYDPTTANARKTQRQIQEDHKAFVSDVKERLYPNLKNELQDSEGKPVRTTADLMRLENPKTGKAFTEEEAGLFLIQAQKHLAEENEKAENRVAEVADVNITIRDESLAVRQKWGALLKELDKEQPGFSDGLLTKFKKQLDVDAESGLITGFKLSPEEFYDTALAGYEQARKALQTTEQAQEDKKKTEVQLDKARNKQDRSDITSSSNTDTRSDEDKEWDAAEQEVFGDRLNKNKK